MQLNASKEIETNKYELEIAVTGTEFEDAVAKAFHKNSGKIQVPGFRKGKAPRKMIEKMYGKGVFWEDAINDLYPSAYDAAVKEAKIEPVDRADIEVLSVDENGFTFKATVFVKPEVKVNDYKGLKAEKVIPTVSEEEIGAELKKMQERNARIINVEDEPAKLGDSTVIDFEGFTDGVAFNGGKGEKYTLVLGSNQFIPGFEDQIVGHKIGEEFDVNVNFPEEYHAEDLKGKPAVFKVKLHEITKTELPELDDEFAKDISDFDTLADLKADIQKKIQEHKDAHANDDVENALIDQIIASMEGEIPEVMYERRIDEMVHDFEHRLEGQGLNLDTYLKYTGSELSTFRKTFAEQAQRQVKIRLALEKIAEIEKLEVSEQDINAEYAKIAEGYKIDLEQVKAVIPAQELVKDLVVTKAIDLVRNSAEITEKAEDSAEAATAPKKVTARKTTKKAEAQKDAE
ncbi:trigger factor [Acetanaerobacterium elongatum]|uniref:Trigger factor n=1 Tax=Acetanaerobacterium elongatum TaxID=258515 RepID=A0A1H0BAJ5_9FIRM|nr:trigger factor [Acetanaerobacterium elongatum]SDN42646.1 trigger factor [Acetanaerobacterium elongatum]